MSPSAERVSLEIADSAADRRASPKRFVLVMLGMFLALGIVSVRYDAPPRFDETGYLILAQSLAEGHGYREIDRPGSPLHSHFPPGWPILLASFWSPLNDSIETRTLAAHGTVVGLWLLSIGCWSRWYARNLPNRFALPLTCALAFDWLWIRLAGELRSESLFDVLSPLVLLAMPSPGSTAGWRRGFAVGTLAGLAILTRHVGVALAAAAGIEFLLRRNFGAMLAMSAATLLSTTPWVLTQIVAGQGTQAELLADGQGRYASLPGRLAEQFLFYVRRLPDSLFGPFVETATVFRGERPLALAATCVALAFAAVCCVGAMRMLRAGDLRPGGLYLAISMTILIIWPFTEAGRFLIPLVPLNLAAFAIGCESIAAAVKARWPEVLAVSYLAVRWQSQAATAIAIFALPFGLYTAIKPWRTGSATADARFESACRWIEGNLPRDAVIAARHPGDVFWRTGRMAVPWPAEATNVEAANRLRQAGARFVFVDLGRYVGDQAPLWLDQQAGNKKSAAGSHEHPAGFGLIAEPEPGMKVYEIGDWGETRR